MEKMGSSLMELPEEIDISELADEALEMLDLEIDTIKRNNFMEIGAPVIPEFEVDIPNLMVVDVQGE